MDNIYTLKEIVNSQKQGILNIDPCSLIKDRIKNVLEAYSYAVSPHMERSIYTIA